MPKKKTRKTITKKKAKKKSLPMKTEKELVYKTKKEWVSKAIVNKSQYEKKYNQSIKDNDGFWKKEGKRINWIKPYTKIKDVKYSKSDVNIKWFYDGTLNASVNCIDRHLKKNKEKTAIITGASRGIGRGIALVFARQGANIAFTYNSSVDSAIESKLKLTTTNGGSANDYSFDLYDGSGAGSDRSIYLNDVNFQWNSNDKNLSISRKLDTSPLHEVSFISDATNNEKFGIKFYPHNVSLDGSNIVITSGNGKPVNVSFTAGLNKTSVGEFINLKNLPPEELIIVLNGSGTARRVSASYEIQELPEKEIGQNLLFTVDSNNEKLIHIIDSDTGHNIAERTINDTGRFKVGGYSLKLSGTANVKDSFSITDNIGGVGDGRNIVAMLDLQEDKFESEAKGNFQDLFSQIVASVGSSVQSSELNKNSAEMIRDAAANSASELSGVNMDDEAAQLIEYQQAYQASARVLQTARELFDTLIDRI